MRRLWPSDDRARADCMRLVSSNSNDAIGECASQLLDDAPSSEPRCRSWLAIRVRLPFELPRQEILNRRSGQLTATHGHSTKSPLSIDGMRFEVRDQVLITRGRQFKLCVWVLWMSPDGGGRWGGELRAVGATDPLCPSGGESRLVIPIPGLFPRWITLSDHRCLLLEFCRSR